MVDLIVDIGERHPAVADELDLLQRHFAYSRTAATAFACSSVK